MPAVHTNRADAGLPVEVSRQVLAKVQDGSKVMQLAKRIDLPGNGTQISVITGDPEAAWVGETEKKPVSNPGISSKIMQAYTLAVLVPFSNQFKRDTTFLYNAIVDRLPKALGEKIDKTVFHGDAPGSNFDTFKSVTGYSIASDPYAGLVAADGDIADHGGMMDGIILAPKGKTALLGAVDDVGRPLFNSDVTTNSIGKILGASTYVAKAAYKSGNPSVVGIAGDWTQAMYGLVQDVKIDFTTESTIDIDENTRINLFQQNMFAVRAEIEFGFRADTDCFVALTSNLVSG